MAAHPVAAYKKMSVVINGVTKNVIVPFRSSASDLNKKAACETSDEDCAIMEIEASATVESSGNSPLLSQPSDTHSVYSDPHSVDLDVESLDISPCGNGPIYDVTDLTLSPEKVVASCGTSVPAQNIVTYTDTTAAACSSFRRTGVVIPINLSHDASTGTAHADNAVVLSEGQLSPYQSVTVVRSTGTSPVVSAECQSQLQFSQSIAPAMSAAPVVIVPSPGTEVSSLSVISSPRTMTKQEAVAAGWFTEEPVVDTNFVSSVELVSLETENVIHDSSTNLPLGISNPEEMVPVISHAEEMRGSYATSLIAAPGTAGNPILCEDELEVDVAIDRKPDVVANETKPFPKFEKLFDSECNEDSYNYGRLMSEEDEPLTAVMEGLDNDNGASAMAKPQKLTKTASVRRGPGRPPNQRGPGRPPNQRGPGRPPNQHGPARPQKTRGPGTPPKKHGSGIPPKERGPRTPPKEYGKPQNERSPGTLPKLGLLSSSPKTAKKANTAKRTGGRPLTAVERYRLKDCGVWLQQLRLSVATVNTRAVWRCLCCRELTPRVNGSCGLCHGRRISESVIDLAVARKFRAGSRLCAEAAKTFREFSLDPRLLLETTTNELKKSPSKIAQVSDSGPSSSLQENKKYLVIQTETGTFVVPVESAVGCIVSEHEIAQMMSSQVTSPSTSYAGEFSNETLLAACSQLEQSSCCQTASSSDKTLSASTEKTSALAAGRSKHVRRRRSTLNNVNPSNSLRLLRRKTRLRSAAGLVQKAVRSSTGSTLNRELRALGLRSRRQQIKIRHRTVQ